MKLSKPSEDTLKGLAKFLKNFTGKTMPDPSIMVTEAKALEKDLRQLRKSLAEMPEPSTIVGDGSGMALPGIGEIETTGMVIKDAPQVLEGNQTILGHLYVTGDVVFQVVPDTDLKEGDMMVKGDLFVTGDINLTKVKLEPGEVLLPTPPQTCLLGMAVVEDKPALFANPLQLDSGAMLLGVRKAEEGVFTEPLYRKPK